MKFLLFCVFFISTSATIAQTITTVAGGGSGTGDGVSAITVQLNLPAGSAFDRWGNFFFAEIGTSKIRKINGSGIISTVAGTGVAGYNGDGIQATLAQLHDVSGVAVDVNGNVYIADCGNYRIRKVTASTGLISTIAGIGTSGFSGDNGPATNAKMQIPYDVCVDVVGNVYFTDNGNYRVRKISTSGIITTYAGIGTMGNSGDGGEATAAQFISIYGITCDNSGNVFVADWTGAKIRKINTSGIITTVAGTGTNPYNGDDIPATSANISPIRFAINKIGELFIADATNYRIRKVGGNGIIHTVAGSGVNGNDGDGGPATAAKMNGINGVSLDTCGNIYISANFDRIRKVDLNPTCEPITEVNIVRSNDANFTIFPNPTSSTITLTSAEKINKINITNAIGQMVYEQQYTGKEQVEINVAHLPPGMYMVRVNGVHVRRFLKE